MADERDGALRARRPLNRTTGMQHERRVKSDQPSRPANDREEILSRRKRVNVLNTPRKIDARDGASDQLSMPNKISAGSPEIAARILADVTGYVETLREREPETETLRRVPDQTIRDLHEFGVFKMAIPVEYGGYALTPSQQHAVIAEIGRGCGSTAWVAWVTLTSQQWLALEDRRFQDEVFKTDWVGPLNSGVIFGPGVVRRVEGGLMLKGRWPFCSGCHHTATHHLGAMLRDDDGAEPILCQVPHDQVKILDDWKVMGQRGTGSNTVVLEEEVFVPDYRIRKLKDLVALNRLAPAPEGLLYQAHFMLHTPALMSAVALGMARAAVELFQARIKTRGISSSRYGKQSEAPITHLQLGQLHCKLLTAELIARNNVQQVESFAEKGVLAGEADFTRAKLETAYVNKIASEITELTLRASGASSIQDTSPLQRLFRDTQAITLHARTTLDTCLEDFGRVAAGLAAPEAVVPRRG